MNWQILLALCVFVQACLMGFAISDATIKAGGAQAVPNSAALGPLGGCLLAACIAGFIGQPPTRAIFRHFGIAIGQSAVAIFYSMTSNVLPIYANSFGAVNIFLGMRGIAVLISVGLGHYRDDGKGA